MIGCSSSTLGHCRLIQTNGVKHVGHFGLRNEKLYLALSSSPSAQFSNLIQVVHFQSVSKDSIILLKNKQYLMGPLVFCQLRPHFHVILLSISVVDTEMRAKEAEVALTFWLLLILLDCYFSLIYLWRFLLCPTRSRNVRERAA